MSDLVSDFTSCRIRKCFVAKALRQVCVCSLILHFNFSQLLIASISSFFSGVMEESRVQSANAVIASIDRNQMLVATSGVQSSSTFCDYNQCRCTSSSWGLQRYDRDALPPIPVEGHLDVAKPHACGRRCTDSGHAHMSHQGRRECRDCDRVLRSLSK